ncbi:MAG: hypothetical protein H0W89_00015 [Candidatus Levybacteria bacterium]|nr:hypothetical protein [Candidatus Levybacteria bacterium]
MTIEGSSHQARAFKHIVDAAVAPVIAEQHRGVSTVYPSSTTKAETRSLIGGDEITHTLSTPDAGIGGIQGLPFVPTHMIEVVGYTPTEVNGIPIARTVFGVRDDDVIVRNHLPKMQLIGFGVTRELDGEEAIALVAFVSSPGLNGDQKDIAMRLQPDEASRLREEIARADQVSARLATDLEEIRRSQRAVWRTTRDIVIE